MGFSEDKAKDALITYNNNVESACNHLAKKELELESGGIELTQLTQLTEGEEKEQELQSGGKESLSSRKVRKNLHISLQISNK